MVSGQLLLHRSILEVWIHCFRGITFSLMRCRLLLLPFSVFQVPIPSKRFELHVNNNLRCESYLQILNGLRLSFQHVIRLYNTVGVLPFVGCTLLLTFHASVRFASQSWSNKCNKPAPGLTTPWSRSGDYKGNEWSHYLRSNASIITILRMRYNIICSRSVYKTEWSILCALMLEDAWYVHQPILDDCRLLICCKTFHDAFHISDFHAIVSSTSCFILTIHVFDMPPSPACSWYFAVLQFSFIV